MTLMGVIVEGILSVTGNSCAVDDCTLNTNATTVMSITEQRLCAFISSSSLRTSVIYLQTTPEHAGDQLYRCISREGAPLLRGQQFSCRASIQHHTHARRPVR